MSVYFVFSDEAGDYKPPLGEKFLKAHPYFIRSGVCVSGEDWPSLRDGFSNLEDKCGLPRGYELKWSCINYIIKCRRNGEKIPVKSKCAPFQHYADETLLGFVKDVLDLMKRCENRFIIYTVTDNARVKGSYPPRSDLHKWHIQDLMQRTEFELQERGGLAVVFLDPKSARGDLDIRRMYASIYQEGDFIEKYRHVMDSLSFFLSEHSIGIRLADYTAGIFNGFMRGFDQSTTLFKNQVWPLVKSPYETVEYSNSREWQRACLPLSFPGGAD